MVNKSHEETKTNNALGLSYFTTLSVALNAEPIPSKWKQKKLKWIKVLHFQKVGGLERHLYIYIYIYINKWSKSEQQKRRYPDF